MGLIRLIILGLVIWLIWRLVNNVKARVNTGKKPEAKLENQNMVSCHYCSVHVPQVEAVRYEDAWFCCEPHKNKFLEDNS
ncbi:MAG: PP0621 family protein [Pseudohongiellaceae bacterium]